MHDDDRREVENYYHSYQTERRFSRSFSFDILTHDKLPTYCICKLGRTAILPWSKDVQCHWNMALNRYLPTVLMSPGRRTHHTEVWINIHHAENKIKPWKSYIAKANKLKRNHIINFIAQNLTNTTCNTCTVEFWTLLYDTLKGNPTTHKTQIVIN